MTYSSFKTTFVCVWTGEADKAKHEEKKKFNLKILETQRAASEAFRDVIEKVTSSHKHTIHEEATMTDV
jgi:hypothetical protein